MSTLNKESVRNEVNRLKADFERLSAEGQVSGEIRLMMGSLFMIVELILSIFLVMSI